MVKKFLTHDATTSVVCRTITPKKPSAKKITPIGLNSSMTASVLNLICQWQLDLEPVTRNVQSQVNTSMKRVFDKTKYLMNIIEPEPRIMDLFAKNIWRKNLFSKYCHQELSKSLADALKNGSD